MNNNIEITKEETKENRLKRHFKKHKTKYGIGALGLVGIVIVKRYGDMREDAGFNNGWYEGVEDNWNGLRNQVYYGMINITENKGVHPFGWTIDDEDELRDLIEMSKGD